MVYSLLSLKLYLLVPDWCDLCEIVHMKIKIRVICFSLSLLCSDTHGYYLVVILKNHVFIISIKIFFCNRIDNIVFLKNLHFRIVYDNIHH